MPLVLKPVFYFSPLSLCLSLSLSPSLSPSLFLPFCRELTRGDFLFSFFFFFKFIYYLLIYQSRDVIAAITPEYGDFESLALDAKQERSPSPSLPLLFCLR